MQNIKISDLAELVRSVRSIVHDERAIANRVAKGKFDYATQVDLRVQQYLERELKAMDESIQFMGEESGKTQHVDVSQPTWILDPIDGTTNLIHHYPQCAVALALVAEAEVQQGIVYNPYLDQMFTAERGNGAYCDGERIRVSDISELEESLVSVGTSPYMKQEAQHFFTVMARLFEQCQDIRRCGSAALDMIYVACGVTEGYYEPLLQPWDYAAAMLIVEEAGGKVSTCMGERIPVGFPSSCLATNGRMHEAILAHTKELKV